MKNPIPCVLTIAGSDSSGGAGIQADIKTISATGCYAASVITALTAQNTVGVQAVYEVATHVIEEQLESVLNDLNIKSVKIGMVFNERIISMIASILKKYKLNYVVLDPVMVSKSGCELMNLNDFSILQNTLFPLATIITPNLLEAEKLLGRKIENTIQEQELAALEIGNKFNVNVLLKGGHFDNRCAVDVLYLYQDSSYQRFSAPRIISKHTHGTGCSLSSAIASYLAQGYTLISAIFLAKKYITHAIEYGKRLGIGQGHGPLDHFYMHKTKEKYHG